MLKNISKKLKIIFISIFIVTCIIDFLLVFFFPEDISLFDIDNVFLEKVLLMLFVLFYNFCRYSFIIGIYIVIKLGKKRAYKNKLSEVDFKNNNNYFRDILKNYTPLELSYIDDYKIDNKKDIVSLLLLLNKKKIIKFNENKNIIEGTNSVKKVTDIENFILDKIVFGKLKLNDYDMGNLRKIVMDRCLELDLIKVDEKKSYKNIIKRMLIILGIFFCIPIITNILPYNIVFETISGIIILIIMLFAPYTFIFFIVYLISYNRYKKLNPYVRSEKGEDINRKLEGLKNYLKDFSSLNKKDIEDIVIWEDYLVYSVLFNQNKNIIDEIYDRYFEK